MSDADFMALFGLACLIKGDTSETPIFKSLWSIAGCFNMGLGLLIRVTA